MSVASSRPRPRAVAIAVAVVVVGLLASAVVALQVRGRIMATTEQAFATRADGASNVARSEIDRSVTELRNVSAAYGTLGPADPDAVARYVERADVFGRFPTFTSLLFVQRVPDGQVAAFEAEMRGRVHDFRVVDLGGHTPGTNHWIITAYVPGSSDFQIPVGVDISSAPGFGELPEQVGRVDHAVAASWNRTSTIDDAALNPRSADVMNADFFISVPNNATGEGSASAPDGMVIAAVDGFAARVTTAANQQFDELGFRLGIDVTGIGDAQAPARPNVVELDGTAGAADGAAFTKQFQFDVDGIHWTLTTWRGPDAADPGAIPWIVAVAGVLASLLVGLVVLLRIRAHHRERLMVEERANHAHAQENILESVAEAMVVVDANGTITIANRAWRSLVSTSPSETASGPGTSYLDALAGCSPVAVDDLAAALGAVTSGTAATSDVIDVPILVAGEERWFAVHATALRDGEGGAVMVHSDVSDRRHQQAVLADRAARDPMTGLANRETFQAAYDAAVADREPFAVLYVDLDRFKQINDTHGHGAGDSVLVEVAQRLRSCSRECDVVARFGGDEFALLVHVPNDEALHAFVSRVREHIAQPIAVGLHLVHASASIGSVMVDPAGAAPLEEVLERADQAMYGMKTRARSAGLRER